MFKLISRAINNNIPPLGMKYTVTDQGIVQSLMPVELPGELLVIERELAFTPVGMRTAEVLYGWVEEGCFHVAHIDYVRWQDGSDVKEINGYDVVHAPRRGLRALTAEGLINVLDVMEMTDPGSMVLDTRNNSSMRSVVFTEPKYRNNLAAITIQAIKAIDHADLAEPSDMAMMLSSGHDRYVHAAELCATHLPTLGTKYQLLSKISVLDIEGYEFLDDPYAEQTYSQDQSDAEKCLASHLYNVWVEQDVLDCAAKDLLTAIYAVNK